MTSWHRGCPVHLCDLRLVRATRRGFDRRAHGVIHRKVTITSAESPGKAFNFKSARD